MAWYETLFDEHYLDFYPELRQRKPASADAQFLHTALSLEPGARLLDLGCGTGRHAVALAQLGYRVTGLDRSETLLREAAMVAAEARVSIDLVRRDMRSLAGLGPFDGCVCLYTVLGYFDDAANAAVLRGVHDVLVPGGLLVLDVTNPLALHARWPAERWREIGAGVTREKVRYDPLTAHLTSERTVFRADGGRVEIPPSTVRMYAPHEVARLLEDAGLLAEQLHGGLQGEPFEYRESPVQIWVARKRPPAERSPSPCPPGSADPGLVPGVGA